MTDHATKIQELQDRIRETGAGTHLLPVAGATKPGLSSSRRGEVELVDVSGLSDIIEYDPGELTVTALAGTPVREVESVLAQNGQHLPFDPLLAAAGATLGGTVAAAVTGPNALRHGRVRDFVIGVKLIDGTGCLITGGGKVVKNAAGFDLPKLMVGSIGRLGVMVQLSFKVFPRPALTTTAQLQIRDVNEALEIIEALTMSSLELEALDLTEGRELLARIGGRPETLEARYSRLVTTAGVPSRRFDGSAESELWRQATNLTWAQERAALVRVPITLRTLADLDAVLSSREAAVRYTLGGSVALIGWPSESSLDELKTILCARGLRGTVLIGPSDHALLGANSGGAFGQRIAQALDPNSRFLEF